MNPVSSSRPSKKPAGAQVLTNLQTLFDQGTPWPHDGRRLVFWYDPDGAFTDFAASLRLPDAEVITLGDTPFATKRRLLTLEPHTNFLLYAPFPEPTHTENGLLDLQLTGQVYSADRAAMLFRDLGLNRRDLEPYLRQHLSFFNAQARSDALMSRGVDADADEMALRLAMMCVVADLRTSDEVLLLRALLSAGLDAAQNAVWQKLGKFFAPTEVWALVFWAVGYQADQPTLRGLFVSLTLTHLEHDLHGSLPERFRTQLIAPSARAYAFIDRWLRRSEDVPRYAELAAEITPDLRLGEVFDELDPKAYAEVETFDLIDKTLIRVLTGRLLHDPPLTGGLSDLTQARVTRAWYAKYRDYYASLEAAARLLERQERLGTLSGRAAELFERYVSDLFHLDGAYRAFVCASDRTLQISDVLSPLVTQIERRYVQGFLEPLGQAWSDALEPLTTWQLEGVRGQEHFFGDVVEPLLQKNDREKAFVIISDALRFEVAEQLRTELVGALRGDAELKPRLSMLPSVTKLGMAALLPGRTVQLTDDGKVSQRSQNTQGSDARQDILQRYMAPLGSSAGVFAASDVLEMSREAGRKAVGEYRLIYIYHNTIDATGDTPSSERGVFSACERAVQDLRNLTQRLVNQLNATNVFITADHGFLYQRQALAEADKLAFPETKGLERGRRYVVGRALAAPRGTLSFELPQLTDASGAPLQVVVPRGTLRFSLQGAGSQYVHGGASLQEVTVPVLHYKHERARKGDSGPSQKTGLQVTASARRITNTRFSLTLLQTLPVGERVRPREVKVGFYDAQGKPVTEERVLLLSSTDETPSARQQTLRFSVTETNPDRTKAYYLSVRDTEDALELVRESWSISLAITDDFGDF